MKTMNNILKPLSLLVLVVTIAACEQKPENAAERLEQKREQLQELEAEIAELEEELQGSAAATADRTKLVAAEPVVRNNFQHFITVQGAAESKQNVMLFPEVSGRLLEIYTTEGEQVSKGEVIALIDNEVMQRNLEELLTQYELAATTFERQQRLWDQNIGSEIQYLQAKSQKERLEGSLASLRAQIAKTKVKAPISGIVDEIFLNEGELASPQQPLAQVVNLDQIEVSADVSEAYIGQIEQGDTVEVVFPGLGITREVPIKYVSQVINEGDRTFRLELVLPNKDRMIKPNVTANLRVQTYQQENAVVIPTHLIQQSANGNFVYIVTEEDGQAVAEKVFVKTGKTYQGVTEIIEGLSGDERIITQGYQDVTDQAPIRIKNGTATASR